VRSILLLLLAAGGLRSADYPWRVYVADLAADSVTLAWGKADATAYNSIGRGAKGTAEATVRVGDRVVRTERSWLKVDQLRADTVYEYSVTVGQEKVGAGTVRTWAAKADTLTYFVIGDYGTGTAAQYEIAAQMEAERQRRERAGTPVRFVLALGDNIYGKFSQSGAVDRDWEKKFFAPYAGTLGAIPFKAIIGNHDGNQSERAQDLEACLDNFFMPDRWYRFEYASFVEFLALDTTKNQISGRPAPVFEPGSPQSKWLEAELAKRPLPWRVVAMHHPLFTGGPGHESFMEAGRHWFEGFKRGGVQAVFSGHEHNLQFSERNEATGGIQFVVSGAGGELRRGSIRSDMAKSHIAAWANQYHFLVVTIRGKKMTMETVGAKPVVLMNPAGKPATLPVEILSNR